MVRCMTYAPAHPSTTCAPTATTAALPALAYHYTALLYARISLYAPGILLLDDYNAFKPLAASLPRSIPNTHTPGGILSSPWVYRLKTRLSFYKL